MGKVTAEKLLKARSMLNYFAYKKKDYPVYMWWNGNQYKIEYKGEWEIVEDEQ